MGPCDNHREQHKSTEKYEIRRTRPRSIYTAYLGPDWVVFESKWPLWAPLRECVGRGRPYKRTCIN